MQQLLKMKVVSVKMQKLPIIAIILLINLICLR